VDVSSVLDTLSRWQEQEERSYLRRAVAAAQTEGAAAGARAAVEGGVLPQFRRDTIAGNEATEAARTAYLSRLEIDAQETRGDFERRWEAGEFGDDTAKFDRDLTTAFVQLQQGLDPESRALYGPRLDRLRSQTTQTVLTDFQERNQQKQTADVLQALDTYRREILDAAGRQDHEAYDAVIGYAGNLLDMSVSSRLLSPEEAAKARASVLQEAHAETYFGDFLAAENPREYLAGFVKDRPKDLTPEEHGRLVNRMQERARELEAVTLRTEAQAQTEGLWDESGGDLVQALRLARERLSGELEDDVTTRLKVRGAERDTARKEAEDAASRDAWSVVDAGQGVDAIPVEQWRLLDGSEKARLRTYAVTRAQGVEPLTDWNLLAELSRESTEDPEAYVKRNLPALRDKLSDGEYQNALSWQRTAQNELRRREEREELKGEAKALAEQDRLERAARAQVNNVVSTTARAAGLNPTAKAGTKDAARYGALYERVFRWADETKPTTREAIQDYVDTLLLQGEVTRDWWPDAERFSFELAPEDAERFAVEGIPAEAIPDLVEALTERGQRITPENLKKLWEAAGGQE